MRVLIVDDENSLLVTLAANLELEGFEVAEAGSPKLALERIEREHFDLVLSDIRMPGMSGVELFAKIRALRPALPVVLMSAFALESVIHDALEHGVFAVLPKPFEIAHVAATLHRAGRSPSVLVVDDTRAVADSTASALEAMGLRARALYDADVALDAVRAGDVDVCVVDLVMPVTDGAELVQRIREVDPAVACIAVSGHDVPELMRRVAAAGALACMRKPVRAEQLVHAIAAARARRPAAAR